VSTAPPARIPSTCVRPLASLRVASAAAFSRLALRGDTSTRSPAQVGLGELPDEDHAELDERAQAAARTERRELLGEVARADADDARGHQLAAVVVDVPAQHAREQRRRVLPDVEAGVVLDELEAGHGQRMADAVAEVQPVEHVLDAGRDV